ncbi:MAG: molybdopterin-synthase adenylyltransferase MoeB [Candidatus Thermoplasmatota archaeon]|jgi:adenylyltransferase/sulfurtransferase|nr:molybdopterin-synthase adenylyltransferase MoeB [Candidatus Thermoplasmatota archaeon]
MGPASDKARVSRPAARPLPEAGTRAEDGNALSREDLARYSRHVLLREVGIEGQRRLQRAKVLIVGAGGLGSPIALYLAAAGVGEIGLVDFDRVDISNLQRQILYSTEDVGERKVEAARRRIRAANPHVRVAVHEASLSRENAMEILRPYDVVVDGTDNFATRYLVSDACVLLGKPNVYGSIYRFEGQASVFDARSGPCYRCLYSEPPPPGMVPSCGEAGVLGVLPGLIGLVQATETVKLILGLGETLVGRLMLYDALAMRVRELEVRKDPNCVICGPHATQHELIDYPAFCGTVASGNEPAGRPEITPSTLATELRGPEAPMLIDVREPGEWAIARIDGARLIPQGELAECLDELTSARSLVLYCKSGERSRDAADLLLNLGFRNVRSLRGGIDAWTREIDPSLPRY